MTDRITFEVEALFSEIDSVDLRSRLRRRSRKLTSRCPDCQGRGETWVGGSESRHGVWQPCDTCHPKRHT